MSSRKESLSVPGEDFARTAVAGALPLGGLRSAEQPGRRHGHPSRWRWLLLPAILAAVAAHATPREEPTVAELKARVASANPSDRVHLCVQIAEKQMDEVEKLYAANDLPKAQPYLVDVVSYSELARDYSIQSHKHQKKTEIAVRGITRKLSELLHTLTQDEQTPVKDALQRLDRVRDDLLASMFKKGAE